MTGTAISVPRAALLCSVVLALLSGGAARPARGQPFHIPRIDGRIELDGRPADPAWSAVPALPLTMHEPEFGAPITRTSTIRLAHDGEYLYALGVFEDDGPPRANSLIRDYYAEDDLFNLVIDGFDDDETALWFLVTPRGTRIDGAITDDAEGESWNHPEFDNIWDAAAVMGDAGWSAEMRIPLSSLRFQADRGTVRMGLIAGRLIVRLQERHTFPAIRPGPAVARFKPSLAADVVLTGIEADRPIEIRPYGLGGYARTNDPELVEGEGAVHEVGADVKLGLGPRLTLDLTANTDFAQTEADDERVNLGRFDLFYPEKRQFFLERAGIFDFGDGEDHLLFYSRRIGLSPAGLPERIYAGGRLAGRIDGWDVGLLDMQTEGGARRSRNSAVARVRREVLNSRSYVGAIATGAFEGGRRATGAIGFDGELDLGGAHFLGFDAAASRDSAGAGGATLRLLLQDRDRRGIAYRVGARYTDGRYLPPLGFVRRRGVSILEAAVSFGTFGGSLLQERVLGIRGELVRRHVDGATEAATGAAWWEAARRGGGTAHLEVRVQREDLLRGFALAEDARVPAGVYSFADATLRIDLPAGWTRRAYLEVSGGRFYDGRRISAALGPIWNVSAHLELAAILETNRVVFPARDQSFRGDVARLRFRASASTRLSLDGLVQYNGGERRAAANLRLRYNFREGRDLYAVWSEGHQRAGGGPEAGGWHVAQRSLLVKYSHATWW